MNVRDKVKEVITKKVDDCGMEGLYEWDIDDLVEEIFKAIIWPKGLER